MLRGWEYANSQVKWLMQGEKVRAENKINFSFFFFFLQSTQYVVQGTMTFLCVITLDWSCYPLSRGAGLVSGRLLVIVKTPYSCKFIWECLGSGFYSSQRQVLLMIIVTIFKKKRLVYIINLIFTQKAKWKIKTGSSDCWAF